MTLKEQFENLLGRPIPIRAKPEDIPCIETSDFERLCKHPLVSIRMATYNHGPYIRQAIESIMMQKTDFEYELIIGEDASTDNTREICFELQKKYPDRIRVLWSEKNVNNVGGNGVRIMSRCRGEFMSMCEGDDYWMDEHRLQKQVDIMRQYPNVVLCFGEQQNLDQRTGVITEHTAFKRRWPNGGVIPGRVFAESDCLAAPFTTLTRVSALNAVKEKYDIFSWRLCVGDLQPPRALCQVGDVYVFHDVFATYRNHAGGITKRLPTKVKMDAGIVRMYFAVKNHESPLQYFLIGLSESIRCRFIELASIPSAAERKNQIDILLQHDFNRLAYNAYVGVLGVWMTRLGWMKLLSFYFRLIDKARRVLI